MTGRHLFPQPTACGTKVGHINSRPGTRSTLQRLPELSQTSRRAVAGYPPAMEFSLSTSRFPTMANRTHQRSATPHLLKLESQLQAVVKAAEQALGWFSEHCSPISLVSPDAWLLLTIPKSPSARACRRNQTLFHEDNRSGRMSRRGRLPCLPSATAACR